MTCCTFPNCDRKTPIHIQRLDTSVAGGLNAPTYAFVTRHTTLKRPTDTETRPDAAFRATQRHDATREVRAIIADILNAFIDIENGHNDPPPLPTNPHDAIQVATNHVAAKFGLTHDNINGAWIPTGASP